MKRSGTITSTLLFLIAIVLNVVAATEMNVVMAPNAAATNRTQSLSLAAAQANLTNAERSQVDEHMRRTLSLLNSMTPKQRAQALTAMSTSDSGLDRYVCQLVTESDNALVRHMNEKLSLIKSIPEEQRPQIVASMLNSHNSADRNLAEVIIKHNDQGGNKNAERLKALNQLGPHDRAELISRLANSTIESDRELARAALAESAAKDKGTGATATPTSSAPNILPAGNGLASDARSVAPVNNWPVPGARMNSEMHNGIGGNSPTADYRMAAPAPSNNGQSPISNSGQSPMFNAAGAAAPSMEASGNSNGVRPDIQPNANGVSSGQSAQGLPINKSPVIAAVYLGGAANGLWNGTAAPLAASATQSLTPAVAGSNSAPAAATGAAAASGNNAASTVPSNDVLKSIPMLWNTSSGTETGTPAVASGANAAANAQRNAMASNGNNANPAGDFLFSSPKNVQGSATKDTLKPDAQVVSQPSATPANATGNQAVAGLRDPLTLQTVLVNVSKAEPVGNASNGAQKSLSATQTPSARLNGTFASNGSMNASVAPAASSTGVNGSVNNTLGNASAMNKSSPAVVGGLVLVQLLSSKPSLANISSPSGLNGNNASSSGGLNATGTNQTQAPVSEQLTVTKSIPRNGTVPGGNLIINLTLTYNMSTVKPTPNMSAGANVSALGRSIPFPVNRTGKDHAQSNKKAQKKGSRGANHSTKGLPLRTYPPSPFKAGLMNASGSAAGKSNASAEAQPWSKFGNVTVLNGTDSINPRNDSILMQEDQQLRLVHLAPSTSDTAQSYAATDRIYVPESASNKTSNSSSSEKSIVRIQTSPDQTSWFNTIADYLPSLTAFHRSLYADDDSELIVERTGEAPVPNEHDNLSQGVLGEAPIPEQSKLVSGENRQRLGESPIPSDSISSEDMVDGAAALNGEDAVVATSDDAAISDDEAADVAAANENEATDVAAFNENQLAEEATPNDNQISEDAASDDAQAAEGAVANEASVTDNTAVIGDHSDQQAAVNDDQDVDEAAVDNDQAAVDAAANDDQIVDEAAVDNDQAAVDAAASGDQVTVNGDELAVNDQDAANDETVEAEGVDAIEGETAVAEGDEQAVDSPIGISENAAEADDQVEDADNVDAKAVEEAIVDGEDVAIMSTEDNAVIESGDNGAALIESIPPVA